MKFSIYKNDELSYLLTVRSGEDCILESPTFWHSNFSIISVIEFLLDRVNHEYTIVISETDSEDISDELLDEICSNFEYAGAEIEFESQ